MKNIFKILVVTCLGMLNFTDVSSQAGRVLNADGKTDTYKLIQSFGYWEEVPDCGHPVKHITQAYDSTLKKQVFVFTLHADLDDDRCGAKDRQRAEIKTFGPSPESMKGFKGQKHVYKWRFRLDEKFQPSPNFCHIHQIKADSGPNCGAPIVTLTPRSKSGKEVLQFMVVTPKNVSTILDEVDLSLFKGVWVEVTETILHDREGAIEMEIKRVSDGRRLLHGKKDKVDLWRDGAKFNRPKYGIYRSLRDRSYLRDESVRFSDIEFNHLPDNISALQQLSGWDYAKQTEDRLSFFFSGKQTFNVVDFGALGDNLHDNSAAFTKAIDRCVGMGGGTVYVPKGLYKLSTPLYLQSGINLHLSKEAILSFSPEIISGFLVNCNNLENVKISGSGMIRGDGKGTIQILNSKNILITGCDFDSSGDNISVQTDNDCGNIIIRGNYFRNAQNSAIMIGGQTPGTISNIFVEDNIFGVIPSHIVYIKSDTEKGGSIENVWMRNNHSEGYPCKIAFKLEQDVNIPVSKKNTPVIRYCYFENFTNLNVTDRGISFISLSKNTEPIESVWFKNVQITGTDETVRKDRTRDVYLENVGPKITGLKDITENAVKEARLSYTPGESPKLWSVAAAKSAMVRYPDFTQAYWNAWTYVNGYMACAFERLYRNTGDKTYLEYIKTYIDNFIDSEGNFMAVTNNKGITRVPNVCDNLDNMMSGNTLVMLYEYYKDPRYKKAADRILGCMKSYPRNNDGGFWHGKGLHGQMWIDGIFMGQMFLLRYGKSIGDSDYAYSEAIRQIMSYAKAGEKGNSGLYVHGVYESGHGDRECKWATAENPKSSDVWGEGLGWYALILVEALETIPTNYKGYNDIKGVFTKMATSLKRTQDMKTGGWFQVVDEGNRPDNWIETSGSAMFTYAIQQGINLGILDANEYNRVVTEGYNAIVNHAKVNERGLVDVYEACDGVGVQTGYDKYINYQRALNGKEAFVGFVWATEIVERERIIKNTQEWNLTLGN